MFEKIKEFFAGKKTYGIVIGGIVFNLLASKGWLPAGLSEADVVHLVDVLLGFAGLGTLRQAVTKASVPK